jgi:hypothetical protein
MSKQTPVFELMARYSLTADATMGEIALDLQCCLHAAVKMLERFRDDGDFISGEQLGTLSLLTMADGLGSVLVERLNLLSADKSTEADGMRAFGEMFIRMAELPSLKLPGDDPQRDGCSDWPGYLRLFRDAMERATSAGLDSPMATGFMKAAAWAIALNAEGSGVGRDDFGPAMVERIQRDYTEASAGVPWPDGEG